MIRIEVVKSKDKHEPFLVLGLKYRIICFYLCHFIHQKPKITISEKIELTLKKSNQKKIYNKGGWDGND